MTKVVSLTEAVATVDDGADVALTGFAITRNCIAVAHELIRCRRSNLTVVQVIGGMETDLLVGAGCVRKLIYSGGSLDRFGNLHAVNRAVGSGAITVDEYSSLVLTLRLHAGALGLPFLATRAMLGSDLMDGLSAADVRVAEDPFAGGPVLLVSALRPDVAFVHVDVADESGNATWAGPRWAVRETAFAARRVVLVCEELAPTGTIPPESVLIPAVLVDAVVVVQEGAHPTAVANRYDYDRVHLEKYLEFAKDGADRHSEYLDRFVRGPADHKGYLALVRGDS
jgi:glutaconate CoA-transferase, subunit A